MAAKEARSVGRVPVCLCVLCGLPAAGKSTLSRSVCCTAARRGWRAAVVQYDDLIPEHAFHPKVVEEDVHLEEMHTEWKFHRREVLQCIEQFLQRSEVTSEPQSGCRINRAAWERCVQALPNSPPDPSQADQAPLVFLLDDNFYYPSMRHEVYQLARKHSLGFCQVFLQCDLETCISRNQRRSEPVPTEVLLEMAKRLEAPDPQKNSWEANSISLHTSDHVPECDIQRVMGLISSAVTNPLSPVEDNAEQKEADRQKCATSVVHQADQACRRMISDAMKTARENQVQPEHMRSLATQLNESKARFLHNLRKQFLQESPFTLGDDIDVERVVKKAVDNFDDDRKELLFRITNYRD
ncbi:L-seryl-tRNA(Sec) kinase [Aulostomus maculatus]